MSLAENGALVHLVPMLSDRGLKLEDAALIVSVLGGSSVAGRLLLGWILDYLEGSYVAACSLLLAGVGLFLLGNAQSLHAAVIAAMIAGLGMGCEFDLMPYMLKRYFGMRSFSTMYGLIYTVYAAAGAIAPLILGRIYDVTGSYTRILSLFSGFTAAAGVCMLALPAYRYIDPAPATVESLALESRGSYRKQLIGSIRAQKKGPKQQPPTPPSKNAAF
jgi:nitrate/nitrite transporter NarK